MASKIAPFFNVFLRTMFSGSPQKGKIPGGQYMNELWGNRKFRAACGEGGKSALGNYLQKIVASMSTREKEIRQNHGFAIRHLYAADLDYRAYEANVGMQAWNLALAAKWLKGQMRSVDIFPEIIYSKDFYARKNQLVELSKRLDYVLSHRGSSQDLLSLLTGYITDTEDALFPPVVVTFLRHQLDPKNGARHHASLVVSKLTSDRIVPDYPDGTLFGFVEFEKDEFGKERILLCPINLGTADFFHPDLGVFSFVGVGGDIPHISAVHKQMIQALFEATVLSVNRVHPGGIKAVTFFAP